MNDKYTYLVINLLVIAGPLVLTIAPTVKYYRKLQYVFFSIFIVSPAFILWDVIANRRYIWGFNEQYILGVKIFSLPIEEIFFFITIPFSCIFIFECIEYYLKNKIVIKKNFHFLFFLIFSAASFLFRHREYTCVVLAFCALFFLISRIFMPELIGSRNFWLYIAISLFPFLITNYFLTSIPIVIYNPSAIWGVHVLTIPLEDFFYSYSMLSIYLIVYLSLRNFFRSKGRLI